MSLALTMWTNFGEHCDVYCPGLHTVGFLLIFQVHVGKDFKRDWKKATSIHLKLGLVDSPRPLRAGFRLRPLGGIGLMGSAVFFPR